MYVCVCPSICYQCLFTIVVDIREIREIRETLDSLDFKKGQEDIRMVDPQCCFIILYGSEFRLKTLSVAGKVLFCGGMFSTVL